MRLRIGELLLEREVITQEQLDRAVSLQQRWGARLGMCLVRLGFLTESQLADALSEQLGIPAAPPGSLDQISPEVLRRVPRAVAITHRLVPVAVNGGELRAALADPQNLVRLDEVAFTLGLRIRPLVATEMAIEQALARYYDAPAAAPTRAPEPAPRPTDSEDIWDGPQTGEWRVIRKMHATPPLGIPSVAPVPAPPPPAPPPCESTPSANRQQKALAVLGRAIKGSATARPRSPTPVEVPVATRRTSPGMPVFQMPPPPQSPFATLAAVTSRAELMAALTARSGQLLPSYCVLAIQEMTAVCAALQVSGTTRPPPGEPIPLDGARWLIEVRTRGRVELSDTANDPHLTALLPWIGLQPSSIVLGPVLEEGAVRYVLLGQMPGAERAGMEAVARKLGRYLAATSDALRMLALREHIASRSDDDLEPETAEPPGAARRPTAQYAIRRDRP
jgi:hypothetical protein